MCASCSVGSCGDVCGQDMAWCHSNTNQFCAPLLVAHAAAINWNSFVDICISSSSGVVIVTVVVGVVVIVVVIVVVAVVVVVLVVAVVVAVVVVMVVVVIVVVLVVAW